ncbi:DUF3859 domain-containing protein [Thalassorhabdomicrobium marinisediminis]|uniref:DUF3859 domain-containing protein n=1 Tax=Thalassorhabdomicrobium marinisediminis TaxID=2170577 RepID=A0A2T7FW55_9RHOB|nr:DUF3859 domain-containing protein [Thalassorhabdomicrobium marinisediminis]PVA06382.1 DUF3859 domain-containing protein [Thalassorhabdomicrobium marinisediminis]
MRLLLTTVCALTLGGGAAVSQDATSTSPRLGFFKAGVLCAQDSLETRAAPDTVAGTTHVIDEAPPFVSPGPRVPAVIGIGFGVRAGLKGDFGQDGVTMTVTHPPFTGAGKGATRQSFVTSLSTSHSPSITFYQFDYPYELALGEWTMTAEAAGEILYQVSFTVVPPAALPELANACGYQDPLS